MYWLYFLLLIFVLCQMIYNGDIVDTSAFGLQYVILPMEVKTMKRFCCHKTILSQRL